MMIHIKLLLLLSGSLSRRESRKDLRELLLYNQHYMTAILYSLLMLQDCLKMLVFDRLGFLPLYSGILQFSPKI
jgi:hypothetical protein